MSFESTSIKNHVSKIQTWNPVIEIPNESFSYIDLSSVDKDTKKIDEMKVPSLLGIEAPSRARQIIESNDILVSTVRPNLNGVAFLNTDYQYGTASTGYCILRTKPSLNGKYLFYWVQTKTFVEDMVKKATGANYPAVSDRIIKGSKIPLPPLATQQKIAAILDEADKVRQLNKQLIDKYDALTQSLFLDMFGDSVTNPKGWEKVPMEKLMKIVRGGSPRPIEKYLGGNYPWIKIGDCTKGDDIYLNSTKEHIIKEGLNKTRLLPAGSLIFANCGVSLGFARIISFEGCIHDGWLAFSEIDEKILNEIYLLKTLNSITRYFRETAPDGTQPNLNTSIMKSFKLILPPINLQNQFEKQLLIIMEQKAQAQASLQKSEELFHGLLQRAFKGEVV